ncbi:MAG: BREX-2 system adenine-specific DNA-methyltransferase PglX [Myxococcales bacterium]
MADEATKPRARSPGKTSNKTSSKKQLTLTQALAQFLTRTLLPDLKERAKHPAVNAALMRQWQAEKAAHHTADAFLAWEPRTLEQVGAAWILSCVFVRTLEDRELLGRRRIAGPGASDSEQLFFEIAPSLTARDYLLTVFKEVSSLPGAEDLLGPRHNPLWRLSPSNEAARSLLDFFRQQDASDVGAEQDRLAWRFEGDDTRFLGDLYQDLSEEVRKRYALLQTPDFVERFILDQTLEPAIAEFGLETVRMIDPACGSGHFLLGAFDRLLSQRRQAAPAVDVRDHALAALGQVYGVDVNPFAVAITRFRLTLAYLHRTGITKLAQSPRLPLNLVVADSLLHGAKNTTVLFAEHESAGGDYRAWGAEMFALDDPQAARRVFGQRYHAVVGNPPYITCKDSALREVYRERYRSAAGKYALAAPFTERFFDLAVDNGFVGMINANSFMKREFGKALIEEVLPLVELTSVIDTSGAYIPGCGTPTVLLFGRNRTPTSSKVHAVLGRRGEPSTPADAGQGLVWRTIVDHQAQVGFEDEYISVAEMLRVKLSAHPWSLGGGGAADLKALLEDRAEKTLVETVTSIGFMAITGEDEVFARPLGAWKRVGAEGEWLFPFGIGANIRDWDFRAGEHVFFPYRGAALREPTEYPGIARALWPWRRFLLNRPDFGGKKYIDVDRPWFSLHQVPLERLRIPISIAFACVATHNHFVLDRGGKVFNRSAPIIKLPESATEDDHLALLAYLNSSTACFWMKQVCHKKSSASQKHHSDPARAAYEFAGTPIIDLPIPEYVERELLIGAVRRILLLAHERAQIILGEAVVLADGPHTIGEQWQRAWSRYDALTAECAYLQEEIDWAIYRAFALAENRLDGDLSGERSFFPVLGSRPFEQDTGYNPGVSERIRVSVNHSGFRDGLPDSWKGRKGEVLGTPLALIESPEFKRQWRDTELNVDFGEFRQTVQRQWILTKVAQGIEDGLSNSERPISIRLGALDFETRLLVHDVEVARLLAEGMHEVFDQEAVPCLSASLFADLGLAKHASWRKTWALQRREDLGESVGDIPVPPKYDQKDYRDANYWRLRGKLDVPKERFISYPGCEKDGDPSPLIGWAGWNHLQRAQALVVLYQERKNDDGWARERLMPMLVGLHELMFWLELWHSQPDGGSQNPAREFKQFLDAELNAHGLTVDDLEAWRPPARKSSARRASPKVTSKVASTAHPADGSIDNVGEDAKPKRARRGKTVVATTDIP